MNVLDLFAGPGGWDLAARALGINPLGIEWDDAACQTRLAAGLLTVQADIAELEPRDFEPIDGLIASPPCPSFSKAGRRPADGPVVLEALRSLAIGNGWRSAPVADPRSLLTCEPLRWAMVLRPRWIALEQVPAVLPIWQLMGEILETMGYRVWTGRLRAETFGVPQTRERAFLIASLERPVGAPAPTHSRYYERDPGRLDLGVLPWVSMAEALGWGLTDRPAFALPAANTSGGGPRGMDGGSGQRSRVLDAVETGLWAGERMPTRTGAVALDEQEAAALQTFPSRITLEERTPEFLEEQRRWAWNRPAPTVGTTHGGVNGKQARGHINVTELEASVLQSFPDGYPWQGNKSKRFEQIGNAVPPLMARSVLEAVRW